MAIVTSDLVVTEIMSRVPGKSLARFRSVSKQFRSLLSDPYFLRLHHSRSRDSLFTLKACQKIKVVSAVAALNDPRNLWTKRYNFQVTNKGLLVHDFTLDFIGLRIKLLSCQHQLLCVACSTGIHLYDPLNNVLKKLPDSPSSPWCFNRSHQECVVSFGFVDAAMQYKVVKWPHDLDENRTRRLPNGLVTTWKKVNQLKFEILNIDINVEDGGRLIVSPWRMLKMQCPYLLQLSSQVHVNGFIYWTTADFQIVSFSLQDETFSTLNPKPPCFHLDTQGSQKSSFFTLCGSRGNLWMVDYDVSSQIMEIWKMVESGWAKIHKIDLGGTRPNKRNGDGKVQMLDILSDQVLFKLPSTGRLICYHAKTNTLENKGIYHYDYQLCHFTDGPLSLHNIDMSDSSPHCSRYLTFKSFLDTQPR